MRGGRVAGYAAADAQRSMHSSRPRRIELSNDVGHEQHVLRGAVQRSGDAPVTRRLALRSGRRVEIPGEKRREIAGSRIREETALGLNAAGRKDGDRLS